MQSKKGLVAGGLALAATVTMAFATVATPAQAADATTALSAFGPNTIADIAGAAAPAVVNIEVIESSKRPQMANSFPGGIPFQFFFNGQQMNPNDLFGAVPPQQRGGNNGDADKFKRHDTGSGFIVRPDGYIVTNAHVVRDAEKIKVTLNDKRTFDAKVIGVDYFSDLAVVKIDGHDLPTLKMGTSTGLRPGEFAVAIGSPLGYDHTVTLGIISAVGRSVTDVNGNINFIQTDAAINPGNSGGPLLNLNGEVVGVNTAIRRDAQNIGFSIPVDIAKQVADGLVSNGKVLRPWLGVQLHELDETMSKSLGVAPGTKGVVVIGFIDGSPAEAAGLKQGDVIQKIDGHDTPTAKDIKEYVQSRKVSDVLHFLVMRKNAVQAVAVNVGDYQSLMDKQHEEAMGPKPHGMPLDEEP